MNKIMRISNGDRKLISGEENVHKEAISFFNQFLGVQQTVGIYDRQQAVLYKRLTDDQQHELCAPITHEEVKAGLIFN